MQKEFIFFEENEEPPCIEELKNQLNPDCPTSPYYGFVGNEAAVRKLIRLDLIALTRFNHCCNDLNIAIIGPSGVGKTELVRRHVKSNSLPLVEIFPKAVKSIDDIFYYISNTCQENFIPLYSDSNKYVIPPINIFIDEIHALSNKLVTALLKATEPKDRFLITESGIQIDCTLVHWIIATTDRGKLLNPFDTRFSKIVLNMYTKKEISRIISFNFPSLPEEACDLVSFYCSRIPREALAFAKEMELEYIINPYFNWEEIARRIAQDNDIDEFGMSIKRLNILKTLAFGPISSKRLPSIIGVQIEELENFILPWLLECGENTEPLIKVSQRGYTITNSGISELRKRNLPIGEIYE